MGLQLDTPDDARMLADLRAARMASAGFDQDHEDRQAFAETRQNLAQHGAAGQFTGGNEMALPGGRTTGADALEPRLFAMLANAGAEKSTMDAIGNSGATTVNIFHNLADDKPSFRKLAFRITGRDPNSISDQCELAKVVACWASSEVSSVIEAKAVAERAVRGLPPPILEGEFADFVKMFGKREYKLTKAQIPAEAYFERKLHEASGRFAAEKLTRVTNSCQVDINNDVKLGWNQVSGTFQQVAKAFAVPLPSQAETLRARLEVMGVCFELVKYKLPQKAQLSSQNLTLWDRYIRWLFGAEVWGLHSLDGNGRPRSTPAISHVINFDHAVREEVAEYMNLGHDIATAFRLATTDDKLMYTKLSQPFGIDCGKAECLACSAPGFTEAHTLITSSAGSERRAIRDVDDDSAPGQSKGAKKRAAAAKKKALAEKVDARKAQQDKGQHDRGEKRKRDKAKKGGDKGGGKGTGDNAPACFDHNKSEGCKRTTCRYKHVCTGCGKADHIKPNCPLNK